MAKNPFVKAEKIQRFLKVLIYGASGTGKTYFALNSPRPCAIIDLEGGSAHYATHPIIGGFDRISTKSLPEIEQAIRFCESGQYKTLVVDPITVIWQLLQDAAMEAVLRRNNGRKSETELALTPRDWGAIKRKYNSLMTTLVNLPCHVVLCSREKDLVEVDNKGNMRVVGQKADAEKSTPYLPDVTLQLTIVNKLRVGVVHKDRTSTFSLLEAVDGPTLNHWPIGESGNGNSAERLQTDDEIVGTNATYFAFEERPTQQQRSTSQNSPPPAPKPQPPVSTDPNRHPNEGWQTAKKMLVDTAQAAGVIGEVKGWLAALWGAEDSKDLAAPQLLQLSEAISEGPTGPTAEEKDTPTAGTAWGRIMLGMRLKEEASK